MNDLILLVSITQYILVINKPIDSELTDSLSFHYVKSPVNFLTAYEQATTTIEGINCGDGSDIEFTLVIPDFDKWSDADAATWELKHSGLAPNTDCQPSFTSVAGKVKYGAFSADVCMNSLTENADGITLDYEFRIEVSASGSPTFQYDHDYTITCTYNREKQGLQASFLPQHSITETGTGK